MRDSGAWDDDGEREDAILESIDAKTIAGATAIITPPSLLAP